MNGLKLESKSQTYMRKEKLSMTKEESDRNAAIVYVLRVLKNPMMIRSPAKKDALTLAERYGITVADLINEYDEITRRI